MYVSVRLSKTKKHRFFRKESPALKNPKIIRGETSYCRFNEHGEKVDEGIIKNPCIDGENIIRTELKPTYVLKIGESYRQGKKVESRQKHIHTFDEWAVIDQLLECEENGFEHSPGLYIDAGELEDVPTIFPDADLDAVWDLIEEKLRPLEDRILSEFKKTEEYRWWLVTNKLKKELEAEKAEKKQQEQEEKFHQYRQSYYQQKSDDMSRSSEGITLSQEEARLINSCYRAMAAQLHPDKGGETEDMKKLNILKDKLRNNM